MAKLSANGDTEHARWRHPESGAELVLTMKGRLLQKQRGGTFTVAARYNRGDFGGNVQRGAAEAERRGMERVTR